MKSRTLTGITAMALLALALPVQLVAQHTRYKLVDLGTLGGPSSYGVEHINGPGSRILNDAGTIAFEADTASPDPFAPNCYNPDCFVAHATRWQDGVLTDLGALQSVSNSSAAGAINARGWSAGQSRNGLIDALTGFPVIRAVLWKDDQIVDLGTLGTGIESLGLYVNDGGEVIGFSTIDTTTDPFASSGFGPFASPTHAFIWRNGTMRDLGTLGGPDSFANNGCNNQRKGLVAGASFTNSTPNPTTGLPTMDPFLWNNGTMIDLGTLGGNFGSAQCANNRGQVTGTSSLPANPGACFTGEPGCHPFIWQSGVMTDLGTLGGDNGFPNWINNAGSVVGAAQLVPGSGLQHAFLWRHGVMTDLGTLGTNSNAFAVNSKGQIVGRSRLNHTTLHAWIWENGGPMTDLNTLIPANSGLELVQADNINESGEIVGLGAPPGVPVNQEAIGLHVFLLVPCAAGETQGCEDNAEGTSAMTHSNPAPVTSATQAQTTASETRPTPSEMVAAWRSRLARRYHFHGTLTRPAD